MFENLKALCELDATSGDEGAVRDFIIKEIDGRCDWKIDPLGNIIAFKKGEKSSLKKVMVDAHTDEVGLIICNITSDGYLKFKTVGGIDTAALMFRKVKINGKINGVISGKPIHLLSGDEGKKLPDVDSLYINIGVDTKEDAEKLITIGDRAVLCGDYVDNGDKIISKAIDNRIGCAVVIELLKQESKYDFYASFSVQEEVGLRGAKTAAFSIDPDAAIVLDATTAADIAGVPDAKCVCKQGLGPTVSFMDGATVYDREYYKAALQSKIICQPKTAPTGGNDAGTIHLNREGVRTVALSIPCRYIHSASSVAEKADCENLLKLTKYMLNGICSGEIK